MFSGASSAIHSEQEYISLKVHAMLSIDETRRNG